MSIKKNIILILSFTTILYFAYSTYFYFAQRDMLFPIEYARTPQHISDQFPDSSKIWIDHDFGKTESWYILPYNFNPNMKYPLMIVAHGNGDVIDKWVNIISSLRENGIAILLVEYPGYGRSEGKPSQETITQVFVKNYDAILKKPEIDEDKIILLGHSIGGGAICTLASKRKSSSMILISTFTKVSIFASQYYLPKFLVKDEFDNLSVVSDYENPLLLVHGKNDNIIPISESEKLKEHSRNSELVILNGGHNMIIKWRPFWEEVVIPFLSRSNTLKKSLNQTLSSKKAAGRLIGNAVMYF